MKNNLLPEVGKTYYAFYDGKVRRSRCHRVKLTKVLPFNEVDKELSADIKEEQEVCDWLYAPQTDYVVFGSTVEEDGTLEPDDEQVFIRTNDDGWFSLGFFASRLDIDGSLYALMLSHEKLEARQ